MWHSSPITPLFSQLNVFFRMGSGTYGHDKRAHDLLPEVTMTVFRDRHGSTRHRTHVRRSARIQAPNRQPENRQRSLELINAIRSLILAIAALLGAATTFVVEIFGR
jgi:hypothetical protein